MKFRMLSLLLALALMAAMVSGCGTAQKVEEKVDAVEDQVEQKVDAAEDQVEQSLESQTIVDPAASSVALTEAEAEEIALTHAGFTADQVTGLRVDFDMDDGVPEYEVDFVQDGWEYDYTIHADTGEILSYDKDNDR